MLKIQSKSLSLPTLAFACLSMVYMTLVLCSAVLTNKVVAFDPAITLAGVLIVPFIFCSADIMSELFGYKHTFVVIQAAFFFQLLFATICVISINLPSPAYWQGESHYNFVFSPLLRMSFASFFSYVVASTVNLYLISKWKVLWKGRYFWIRSIGSSTIGELIYTVLIILLMQYNNFPDTTLVRMIITSYLIKVLFSIGCSIPANIIVIILRKVIPETNITNMSLDFNPFKKESAS